MYDHLTQQQHSQKNSHVNKTSTQKKTEQNRQDNY